MDTFKTRIEAMEHTAKDRSIAMAYDINNHTKLFVHWHYGRKCFEYYIHDSSIKDPDLRFTDLTREQAAELLA